MHAPIVRGQEFQVLFWFLTWQWCFVSLLAECGCASYVAFHFWVHCILRRPPWVPNPSKKYTYIIYILNKLTFFPSSFLKYYQKDKYKQILIKKNDRSQNKNDIFICKRKKKKKSQHMCVVRSKIDSPCFSFSF